MSTQKLQDYSNLSLFGKADMFYEKRIENDGSGNPLYIGYTNKAGATEDDEVWFIVKLTYTAGYVTRVQLPDDGVGFKYAYSARATLFS